MDKRDQIKRMTFEQGIQQLEKIVGALDQTSVSLDQALDLFGEGIELVKHCNILLDSAEAKVRILLEDSKEEIMLEKISGENA